MRGTVLTIFFTLLFLTAARAETRSPYDELAVKGYELMLDMRFDEANEIFEEMIRIKPENPKGYLCKSQSYLHYWQYALLTPDQKTNAQFKELLLETKKIAKEMIEDDDSVDAIFYLGCAYGNLGLHYSDTKSWFRAMWYGEKGINKIEEAVKRDPEYYDAYYGFGMYNYYAATLPKIIKALSFLMGKIKCNREEGIQQLELASSKSDLKGDAKFFLAKNVYLNEGAYETASTLLEDLKAEYPNNHYISYLLAIAYRRLNEYDLSVETLESSLHTDSIKKFPSLHGDLYFTMGLAYSLMNEHEKAIWAHKKAYEISKSLKGFIWDQYDTWTLYEIGNAYEMLGSINMAREYYTKIKQEDNKNAYEKAQARIKNPLTSAQINLIKGRNYLKYKKYVQAEKVLRDMLSSGSNSELVDNTFISETYLYLGELEYHLEEYESSILTLNKVFTFNGVKKDWISPWAHYWIANCYKKSGNIEKAEQNYEIAYKYKDDELRIEIETARNKTESQRR